MFKEWKLHKVQTRHFYTELQALVFLHPWVKKRGFKRREKEKKEERKKERENEQCTTGVQKPNKVQNIFERERK